jgi:hypothetical protein
MYRNRLGLCSKTSPKGSLKTSSRNHDAPTRSETVNRYVPAPTTERARTRNRRARSRNANGTSSSVAAPRYPPGADASASGHAAQMPPGMIGRSSAPPIPATVPPNAS